MTSKAQTMLTIALTAAVSVLMVDRMIEPAQAKDCPSAYRISQIVEDAVDDRTRIEANRVIERVLFCMDGARVTDSGRISTYCDS